MSAHSDLLAVLATTPFQIYDGEVPPEGECEYPYLLVQRRMPRVKDRSLTRSVLASRTSWLLTPAGLSPMSVAIVVERLVALLDGARVAGSRLEAEYIEAGIEEDPDSTFEGRHVFYSKLQYSATLST